MSLANGSGLINPAAQVEKVNAETVTFEGAKNRYTIGCGCAASDLSPGWLILFLLAALRTGSRLKLP